MPDAEAEKVPAAYLAHLAALGPALPDVARRLATEVSLHDALLRGVERKKGRLELLFRAGNQQTGYFDAMLEYEGAEIADAEALVLQNALGRQDVELLSDEFDSHESGWSHTLLFWGPSRGTYQEVAVTFSAVSLRLFPAPGRFEERS
jgi:hypothetical protein